MANGRFWYGYKTSPTWRRHNPIETAAEKDTADIAAVMKALND